MLYIEVLPEPDGHDGETVPLLLAPVAVRQPAPTVSVLLQRTLTPLEEGSGGQELVAQPNPNFSVAYFQAEHQ